MKEQYPKLNKLLKIFTVDKKLSPLERLTNRLAYAGTTLIIISPYLLKYDDIGAYTYILGGILSIPQVWIAKQWNVVIIHSNLVFGYGLYILRNTIWL